MRRSNRIAAAPLERRIGPFPDRRSGNAVVIEKVDGERTRPVTGRANSFPFRFGEGDTHAPAAQSAMPSSRRAPQWCGRRSSARCVTRTRRPELPPRKDQLFFIFGRFHAGGGERVAARARRFTRCGALRADDPARRRTTVSAILAPVIARLSADERKRTRSSTFGVRRAELNATSRSRKTAIPRSGR